MLDINFTLVPLGTIFCSRRGNSKLTKKYCNHHKGEYEVYTGTTIGTFAKIDTYEYSEPTLTYTTDGEYAGTVKLIEDDYYSIGAHRAILTPLSDCISLKYFEHILSPIFMNAVRKGDVPSLSWNSIKTIAVPVPTDENGSYSIKSQRKLAEIYDFLKQYRYMLLSKVRELNGCYLSIDDNDVEYESVPIKKIFDYQRGKSCTRKYCDSHKGPYPVWSANNTEPLSHIDTYDYDGEYITLSRNGFAGKTKILTGRFSINEDRFLLVPKDENISIPYMSYALEPIFRAACRGRSGHNGENEFTKLSFAVLDTLSVKVPVAENGLYDFEMQERIAQRYNAAYEVKNKIVDSLMELVNASINII